MAAGNITYESGSLRKRELSLHARKRSRQRAIPEASIPLILAFGHKEFDGRGGVRYMMTSDAVEKLRNAVGASQKVDALTGVYAVVSTDDQSIITLGHRHS